MMIDIEKRKKEVAVMLDKEELIMFADEADIEYGLKHIELY